MTTSYFNHWRDVPEDTWRWKSFSPAEIACRGSGSLRLNEEALDKLQALRDRLGKPLIVRSAYRSPAHNRAVGGAPRSKHMDGSAFDIAMANHDPIAFEAAAREVGFLGFGFYPRSGFIHIDLGPGAAVGRTFPGAGDCVRRGSAARAGSAGRKPNDEGQRRRRSGDAWRRGRRGRAKHPGRNPVRHPAARTLSRYAAIGVHRRGRSRVVAVAIYARIDDWKRGRR